MCLVIAKPYGAKLPKPKALAISFHNNPDGAGIAYWQAGQNLVRIRKGFMKLEQLTSALKAIPNPQQSVILIHFRLATQGQVTPGNCHPFPLSNLDEELQATETNTSLAIAHNGVIFGDDDDSSWTGSYYYGTLADKLSDTQKFIKNYLFGMDDALWNTQVHKLIVAHTDSKFVFLSDTGRLALLGTFIKDHGVYYSNAGYKHKETYVTATSPAIVPAKVGSALPYVPPVTTYHPVYRPACRKADPDNPCDFMAECEVCGDWYYKSELVEYEDMTLCKGCHLYFADRRGV